MISAHRIVAARASDALPVAIESVAKTASTNSDLLARIHALSGPTMRIAYAQTGGRGRAGRRWISAPGSSLTFSLAWKFALDISELSGLALAVGVSVSDSLSIQGVRTALKWPNDILMEGKKLGGILIETAKAPDGVWAVIGIGLNLTVPDALATQIGQMPAESRWLAQMDRHTLIAGLLDGLCQTLLRFEAHGLSPFLDKWSHLNAHANHEVRLMEGDRILAEGKVLGIDAIGRLLLETPAGRIAATAGDVSLRKAGG